MIKLKKLKLPHTLVLIYIMVVLTVIATWIVPGGEYQRVEKERRTVPVADLPLYSGFGYRIIVWAIGIAIAVFIVMRYASHLLKNPKISPTYKEDLEKRKNLDLDSVSREKAQLRLPSPCPS